jgi:glycosyltransferase involved in cell wall biosynthesis
LADGRNALLFTVGSQASFAEALLRLCGDIELRRALGAEARRTVEQTPYTWAHNAGRIAALARAARTTRAFSSEVGSGSRKENAHKQKPRAPA